MNIGGVFATARRFLARSLLLILAGLAAGQLAACGPIYDTEYSFKPPSDAAGRQLVGQCRQTQLLCEQNCELRERSCRADARTRGMIEYHAYVERRRREKAEIKKSPSDFVSDWSCNDSACTDRCERDYRGCYKEAGGSVTSKQVCVAFCDQR